MNDDFFVCVRSLQWNGLYIIIFQIPIHLMIIYDRCAV